MQWTDDGIILSIKKISESSANITLLTANHGRHLGLFTGIKNKKNKAFLQQGSAVNAVWKARLENQLGRFQLEPQNLYWTHFLNNENGLNAMLSALSLVDQLLPERQSYPHIFTSLSALLAHLTAEYWPILYLRWEMKLLSDIGFGLDLSQCALTGTQEDLCWVSPLTGKAASYSAGLPWKDKLLPLPALFLSTQNTASHHDILCAFQLTGYFLQKALDFHGHHLPAARERLILPFFKV